MTDAVLVLGLGVSGSADPAAALRPLRDALARIAEDPALAGAPLEIATWVEKAEHPVVRALATALDAPVRGVAADRLRAAATPDPGSRAAALTADRGAGGVPEVALAAVRARGARALGPRRVAAGCTFAIGVRGADPAGIPAAVDDPLRHHGDVDARGARLDLAVNVAVPRPPAWLADALAAALPGVASYPDERPAREALAADLGVPADRLLLTNGAAEAFSLIAQARRWRHPLVVHPQFTEPDAALTAAGHEPRRHHLAAADGFRLDAAAVPGQADLVVVGNPTNPTSVLHPAAELARLRASGPPDRVLVVDEAFLDVTPGEAESLLPEVRGPGAACGGLLVLRSLTKTFGLAGIRAGIVAGDPTLLARLREVQPPWSVNALALAAIAAIAGPRAGAARAHVDALVARLPGERRHLLAILAEAGFEAVPDAAGPFVLARHPRAADLRERLRGRGIAVRRGDTFPGLDASWMRLAVRDRASTDALAAALRELGEDSGRDPGRDPLDPTPAAPPIAPPLAPSLDPQLDTSEAR